MIGVVAAILTASLLGSAHCVGMCGAFVALAVGGAADTPGARIPRWRLNAAYQLGRLMTYATLGVIAGALGAAFNLGGGLVGVQESATVLSGGVLVTMGLATLARRAGVRVPRPPVPGGIVRLATRGHAVAAALTPARRAMAIGMLTTLLPCGWLYAFVIAAAGTAHPAWGVLAMGAFWLGTVPYLAALGATMARITGPLRTHLPTATSLVLIGVGTYTVAARVPVLGVPVAGAPTSESAAAQVERVRTLDPDESCPLCAKGKR
jgi:sulfite exporter TauE/SafE